MHNDVALFKWNVSKSYPTTTSLKSPTSSIFLSPERTIDEPSDLNTLFCIAAILIDKVRLFLLKISDRFVNDIKRNFIVNGQR